MRREHSNGTVSIKAEREADGRQREAGKVFVTACVFLRNLRNLRMD